MTPRCADCPIAGACVVERTAHTTYCAWARRGGSWLAKVRELSGEPGPPTLPGRIADAAGAAARVIRAAASGSPVLADPAETARRLAICGGCESLEGGRCAKCGCVMRFKARLATEAGRCPAGRW
jgi:hypothetical protein